nr:MAG TPA: hypothetical protein [Herelleviridae sp.]
MIFSDFSTFTLIVSYYVVVQSALRIPRQFKVFSIIYY